MISPEGLRCLWIGREIPIPANTGDRIYSERLAIALAEQGVNVVFLGLSQLQIPAKESGRTFKWHPVIGRMKPYWSAVFSKLPLVAAALGVAPIREALSELLLQSWDAIVLDNYATAWALASVLEWQLKNPEGVLVHVSHNYEGALGHSLASSFRGPRWKKAILLLNANKIERWEKKIISAANVVTTITEEDRNALQGVCRRGATLLVLTPGYSGRRVERRDFATTSKRVVLVGSFRWIVKQENLRQLLNLADTVFYQNGITLDVIGDVPPELTRDYENRLRATVFHGFVDDYSPIFNAARIAIVPEIIGGGFKLKILDYIFGGLPVAALTQASVGLPAAIRQSFINSDSLQGLVQEIVGAIDRVDLLENMQASASASAAGMFNWSDRGVALRQAIEKQRSSEQ